jgi:hypothetical protein
MSASLPWSQTAQAPAMTDPSQTLQRIEQNTANLLQWVKILVAAIGVLILVNVILFV